MPTVQELESLMVRFLGDNSDLLRKLSQIEESLKRTVKVANQSLGDISSSLKSLGNSIGQTALQVVELDGGFLGISKRAIQLAADAERLKISLDVITGSAKVADKLIQDLYKFAASTPFQVPEVVDTAKKLLAFGVETEKVVDTLKMLGDVAATLNKPLGEIAYTYGSIKTQGHAMTMDLREFAHRSIPIYLQLAKVLKLVDASAKKLPEETSIKLEKMVEDGRISFKIVEEAFKQMTNAGGMFEGGAEKASKSLSGMLSNLKDEVDMALRPFGEDIAKYLDLKGVMKDIGKLAEEFRNLNPEQKKFLLNAGAIVSLLGLTVSTFFSLSAAVSIANAAMTAFNLRLVAVRASVLFLRTAIVAGLAYGIYELTKYLIEDVAELKKFNDEMDRSNQILSKRSDASDARFKGIAESAKAIEDFSKRQTLFNKEIEDSEIKKTAATEAYNKAKAEQDKLIKEHTLKSDLIFTDRVLVNPQKLAEVNEAFDRTKMAKAAVDDLTAGINILNNARLREVHAGGLVLGNTKLTVEELKKLQIEYGKLGLTEDKAKLFELKEKGLSQFELDKVEDALIAKRRRELEVAGIVEEIKKREELISKIKDTSRSLKEEYETRLDITEVQKLQHAITKLEEIKGGISTKFGPDFDSNLLKITEINKALSTARGTLDFAQKLDDFRAIKKILDDIETPLQKLNKEKAKLSDLFQRDQLTWEQYSTAMDKAENSFKDATKAAHDFKDALMGIDAALKGSAESQARINAYKEMLKLPLGNQRDWRIPAPMPREIKGRDVPTDQEVSDAMKFLEKQERLKKRELDMALGYLEERRTAPMPRTVLNPAQSLVPNALNAPPSKAEDKIIDLLTKLATYAQEGLQKEGVVIAPANLNN